MEDSKMTQDARRQVLVEFRRWKSEEVGEDDAIVHPLVLINPRFVAAVLEDADQPTRAVIRMPDGRGFAVKGSYQEVLQRLGVVVREVAAPGRAAGEPELTPSGLEYEEEDEENDD
jgi:hypothetical protein